MMTRKSGQGKLFYQFNLEERVPADHFLRAVNRVVDFNFIYGLTRPFYSHTGAPSVDPVVIFKMALLGYFYGITSERKLAAECRLNLAFMWFLGYDIDETPPDHSILSKARARFGKDVYERFFDHVVDLCQDAGLIEGKKLFLDATLIKANASMDSLVSRPIYQELNQTSDEYLETLWKENPLSEESQQTETDKSDLLEDQPALGAGEEGRGKDSGSRRQSTKDTAAPGERLKTNERWVSRTDPEASIITYEDRRGLFLAHKVHIAVDGGKARIVTAVQTTPGGWAESHKAIALIGQHTWKLRNQPEEVCADRAYGTKEVYRFLHQAHILPSIPRRKPWKSIRQKRLEAGFWYHKERDVYVCPQGKTMYREKERIDGSIVYKVHRLACKGCPNQGVLCKAKRPSLIRGGDQELLGWVEDHLFTERAKKTLRQRKSWPETIFAEMKGPRGLGRATLRGNKKVHIQALLALAVHNLRQLVRVMRNGKIPGLLMSTPFKPTLCFTSPITATTL